uniref:EF-hand domain-containing protein n=1 Tax=Amphiprion percula TaxID=161767 RepID=A0A3P8RW50_AMPPE
EQEGAQPQEYFSPFCSSFSKRYGGSHSDVGDHVSEFCQGEGEPRREKLQEDGTETARQPHGSKKLLVVSHQLWLCRNNLERNNKNLLLFMPLCFLQDTNSASAIKEMQQGLDENNDGKVSFQEYLTLIGYLANSLSQSKTGSSTQEAS